MNRAVASIYAITIGGTPGPEQDAKLVALIPPLISEVNRMEKLLSDPFIRGYLEAREQWTAPERGGVE